MESVKKWLSERTIRKNGLYVHHSPPKLLDVVSAAQLRQWARGGAAGRLERAVLAGQGRRLLAEAEVLPIASHLPNLVAKCDALHAAVEKGSLLELQELLESEYNKRKYVLCCDAAGVGLLHKAIFYDFMDIASWLVEQFPQLVHQRDSEGRTPLHYAVVCRDEASAAALLEAAGAARGARDAAGRTPAFYRGPARTRLTLPTGADMAPDVKNTGLNIKRHNIRIWCHDCDMARLQRVVWEGHGTKLLSEVSNQPVVKKFLEAVPYIMNTIKEMHGAVIENDLEGVMKHAGEPVPPQILSSRDKNNMTVMHKAAGLGHGGILGYIADRYPEGINDVDNEGRTPLHYAAAVRDDQHIYNTLVSLGADESTVDNKNRTPGYYVNRPQEIDKNLFKVLPDAPRTPSSAYPSHWDWKILDTEAIVELNKKSKKKNLKASNENISSKNMSNSISEKSKSRSKGMKASSTHEYIKGLPDLNGTKSKHKEKNYNKDPEDVQDNDKDFNHDEKVDESTTQEDDADNNENENNELETHELETHELETHEPENEEIFHTDENEIDATKHEDNENVDPHDEHDEENEEAQHEADKETEETPGDEDEDHDSEKNEDHSEIKSNKQENEDARETHDSDNGEEEVIDQEESKADHEGNSKNSHAKHESNVDEAHKTDESTEDSKSPPTKGNNEDDDDVQTQGDSHSEYSDIHLRSTAEAADRRSAKRGNVIDDGRNTQDSLIEGIISGDAEQDTLDASIMRDESIEGDILIIDSQIDPEVTELINTSNMEMLAALVLNGEGARLVGRRSGNTELQAFLDNVPTYMQKINKVHLAARDGNIRDLQAALDRRKFAIARDPISPNGATPLHIATVFGKTNIIKYLGGRFPETLSAVDFEGRTALHYAAVIPDNGHYYNMLQQLGANSKDLDDNGRSAEEYQRNSSLLSFNQLISDYGISEEVVQEMLSDKGPTNTTNGHVDIPTFKTDEGRYLAQSLGDPLIKGLTEVANVKPKDPVAFLASFLHNFPDQEKTQLGTQESNMIVTQAGEVENDQPPLPLPMMSKMASVAAAPKLPRSAARTATRPHRPIDVVTVEPQQEASPDAPEAAYSSVDRDEHGQSMLHFAAARSHTRNALFQLLQESGISLGYRDELYRTARDVSIQANVLDNKKEIDRWVLHLAARGNTQKIMELLLEGYDHILDVVDEEGVPITDVVAQRGDSEMSSLLASMPTFEESREALHGAIRRGDLSTVQNSIDAEGGRTLARGQNSYGRTTLHIAVLAQHEDIVAHLAQTCPELLRIGDNLERTPLHYAMGVEKMESLSRLLIRAGSKRVLKDLKGRQPSYYFMNKSDILRLKEEEEVY